MKRFFIHALSACSLLLGCGQIHAGETAELPLRKAGLWDVRTETDEGSGVTNQLLTMCIGEQMEQDTVRAGMVDNRSNCAQYEIKKAGDTVTVDAACTYDERQVKNHTELKGDFKTTFLVTVESTTHGKAPRSMGGQPVDVLRKIRQEGKYLGESCGELKAGEAKTKDGQVVTVR